MNLKNKVVVITGSSKGFGKALAEAFLKEEAKVVVNSSDEIKIKKVAEEMGTLGIYADVTKEEDLENLSKEVIEKFGGIDIWINNAGIWMSKDQVENFDMNKVRKMFDVNVIGTINGTRVALRNMKEKGEGTIINIISDSALKPPKVSASVYSASKWAINGFTKNIREEYKNISILSIFPGAMKTDLFGKDKPDNFDNFMNPEYVAGKVIDNLKQENPLEELVVQNK